MSNTTLSREKLARYIDHTLLKPEATEAQIKQLCEEAVKYGFKTVCVNGSWVTSARSFLGTANVGVACVVGFPLGAMSIFVKASETGRAIDDGATEIDMVLHVGNFKSGNESYVIDDIRGVVDAAQGKPVKVILETGSLTNEKIVQACGLVVDAGAQFVKTSTGFGMVDAENGLKRVTGATMVHVALMRETVGPDFGVKASGGIKTFQDALAMIKAGATRLGTSNGVAIMEGLGAGDGY